MKVDELRVKLYKLKQDEVIRLAVEFYKLVPKAKKEGSDLDELINSPEVKKAKPTVMESLVSFDAMATEVNTFIGNAQSEYYLYPNKIVSKKERPTWRFKVKAWYKEVTNPKTYGYEMGKKAEICANLYNLVSAACNAGYFSTDDPFNSVGVEQAVFFRSVLQLIDQTEGKISLLNRGLEMAINNPTGPNTFHSSVMQEFVDILDSEPLKYDAIDKVEKMIAANQAPPPSNNQKKTYEDSFNVKYYRDRKTNTLTEMGFRLYVSLSQYEEAIVFYNKYAIQRDEEVKLYILIDLLFESRQKTHIQSVLEAAETSGIKLRDSLTKMLVVIQKTGMLPQRM